MCTEDLSNDILMVTMKAGHMKFQLTHTCNDGMNVSSNVAYGTSDGMNVTDNVAYGTSDGMNVTQSQTMSLMAPVMVLICKAESFY